MPYILALWCICCLGRDKWRKSTQLILEIPIPFICCAILGLPRKSLFRKRLGRLGSWFPRASTQISILCDAYLELPIWSVWPTNCGWCSQVAIAASFGLKEAVKAILEGGANIEAEFSDGWTALSSAAWNGEEAVIELLLKHGANIEAKNNGGWTALANACRNGHLGVILKLLAQDADIETKNNTGWTPLLGAAWHGNEPVVRLLLEQGALIEARNNDGWTSLHQAAAHGDDSLTQLLLDNGASVDARSDWGWTPLMSAAICKRPGAENTVEVLLQAGSDRAARNTREETAYDKAAQHGNTVIMSLLRYNFIYLI